ncbi:class I SAM-dependent methyltransferase [Candidatus Nomurabacteria bacterium]|nr:class I SAM-dependent methyltransferase [Candidatus Nomurabacteria bacterium]
MKNKDFFYLQYNKIDWKNQEQTGINSKINDLIINKYFLVHDAKSISIFDIGFGIGFFLKRVAEQLGGEFDNVLLEGCEPSRVNFENASSIKNVTSKNISVQLHDNSFQDFNTNSTFDFVTAIYVFPHFLSEEFPEIASKIFKMLKPRGKAIIAVANQEYIENKLHTETDLFIERQNITHNNNDYKETLHYSAIPGIGTVVDYNRDEQFYLDIFAEAGFNLFEKQDVEDNGFIGTLFVFEKPVQ